MADSFIGLPMLVTLRNPPMRLKGTVSEVQAGHGLTLTNVWNVDINRWEPRVSILSSNIVDIVYLRDEPSPQTAVPAPAPPPHVVPVAPQAIPQVAPPVVQPPLPTKPAAAAFVDPAILSVGKRPGSLSGHTSDASRHQPNTSEKRDPTPAVIPSNNVVPIPPGISTPTIPVVERLKRLQLDAQTSTQDSADEDIAHEASSQPGITTSQKKKNNRRTRRAGNSSRNGLQEDSEASPQVPRVTAKGKGWRQTPILQSTASFQPFNSLKKMRGANDNGWASEDVTDVQEAGDFDFESGLAKFNKQDLFEQMRKDDLIDEADRLVSHNRVPKHKPGTAGGKNLHHSENVLDMPSTIPKPKPTTSNDFWNSEADDGVTNGADRLSGRDQASRQGSRRGESKAASSRRSNSRKASGIPAAHPLSRVNSSGVSHYRTLSTKGSRPSSRLSARAAGVDKKKQPASTVAASPQGLYVLPSDRKIEPVSALQMLNLENIAHNEIGLTEEMMTENAGRGIAEVTLTALSDPAIKVRHSSIVDPTSGNPPPPTVVVLAGNNKSGIRAVAAARHLRNKNISVIVCVVGLERGERDLLEDMRQQVRLYKNMGGRIFSKGDFFEHLRKISIPMLTIDTPRSSLSSLANPAPIMLIIDALLGLAISFEELRNGDQATVYELIEWANRNEAFALAVDIPTGIDPSTGKVSVIDGNKLYVKPRYVVAVGAPKRGLLEALMAAENDDGDTVLAGGNTSLPDDAVLEWKLYLVDLGLGPAMWKKAGTKMRRGIDFEDRWVVEMTYRGLAEEEDEELV